MITTHRSRHRHGMLTIPLIASSSATDRAADRRQTGRVGTTDRDRTIRETFYARVKRSQGSEDGLRVPEEEIVLSATDDTHPADHRLAPDRRRHLRDARPRAAPAAFRSKPERRARAGVRAGRLAFGLAYRGVGCSPRPCRRSDRRARTVAALDARPARAMEDFIVDALAACAGSRWRWCWIGGAEDTPEHTTTSNRTIVVPGLVTASHLFAERCASQGRQSAVYGTVPALRCTAEEALHRVRDRGRSLQQPRAPRPLVLRAEHRDRNLRRIRVGHDAVLVEIVGGFLDFDVAGQ